ncbi:PEP-CTERM sorting domain-containing protein [Dasania sp. GY-MA-18]|uniref:PEP-CTERM sorting domain-containing protein n=1 Tax=Dasania phycosphaerae TaxID=2950436 RepID=A0A9J6RQQ9_9GAMM|nr:MULTISPECIES: PEP-CTERM sorting domain-containing protein [Dasania]MCR8924125.1 PEP-CTERM sorting domain-containing protein [Dasania sp. GY-MA-18]MCZ0866698.1 PEP-CTERM sorting domain-containing protein [Dasania phycosphaerae]MCZ0870283.1 PEP-CTERM sorting domain-containing protein [Dasania phycosphaerae]
MAFLKNIMSAAALIGAFTAGTANAAYIPDTYLGKDTNYGYGDKSTDYSNTDKIGSSRYEVYGAQVGLTGSILEVLIDTNFYANDPYEYFGDLFISTNGYNPVANSSNDFGAIASGPNSIQGSQAGAPGEIWELAFDTSAMQLLSLDGSEILDLGTTKQGQEVRVNSGGTAIANNQSSFSEEGSVQGLQGSNVLKYTIDLSFLGQSYFDDPDLAIHWTMFCGNDVFEAPVSEPGSLALLSLGLIGLGAIRRKSAKR